MKIIKPSHEILSMPDGDAILKLIELAGRTCYHPDTEVLTDRGWVKMPDVEESDNVLTYSLDKKTLQYEPSNMVVTDYDGDMVVSEHANIKFSVTPDHRMVAIKAHHRKNIRYNFVNASRLNSAGRNFGYRLPKWFEQASKANDDYQNIITFDDVAYESAIPRISKGNSFILNDAFITLLAAFVTEGHLVNGESGRCGSAIVITQGESSSLYAKIINSLNTLGFIYSVCSDSRKPDIKFIRVGGGQPLRNWFRDNCGKSSKEKHLPEFFRQFSHRQLKLLLEILYLGDGSHSTTRHERYMTASKILADQIQEIFILLGKNASIASWHYKKYDSLAYFVENSLRHSWIVKPSQVRHEIYSGKVYCPSTIAGIVCVRLKDNAIWCGNCYKSEDKITPESAKEFVRRVLKSGHHSVIEHVSITVKFVCDRGISHEIVRHRLASYSQESTRYVSSVNTKDEVIETEQEVIDLYRSGISMRRISELSKGKFTEWDAYKILDANDIERRPLGNTGVTNYTFFDSIDTPEKAYLLGVIQADGSVRGGECSPQISITQHEDFAWYLHRMVTDFIRPSAKANKDKRCRQITFTSPKLRDALISLGIVPNKSYEQTDADADKLWMAIPDQLKPSFLRGFLDGDGGIRFFKQNNAGQTDSCNIYWLGHRHLLEHIAAWLDEKFDYEPKVKSVPGTKHLHRVVVTNPHIGNKLVKLMLTDFKFPYGHPAKTARMIERVGGEYGYAEFGDPKFIVIEPEWINKDPTMKFLWLEAMDGSERAYSTLRMNGASPQQARSVLPNSLKTEIVMTCNIREWKWVFRLRCSKAAHPQIRELMLPLLKELHEKIPVLFDEEYQMLYPVLPGC